MNLIVTDSSSNSTSFSIIRGIQNRDPDAFSKMVRIYGPMILKWVRSMGMQEKQAEDVTQNVLIMVWKHGSQFRKDHPNHGFRKWLYVIARQQVSRVWRKDNRFPAILQSPESLIDPNEFDATVEPPEDASSYNAMLLRAYRVMCESLTERTRDILDEIIFGDLCDADIAARFETTPGNIRVIRTRYLAKLRALIELHDQP